MVVKPRHETTPDGHDFRLVFSGDLWFEGEWLVQRYVVPSRSYKLFRVGDRLRATEERRDGGAAPARVSRRFDRLADAVAAPFDLELFELACWSTRATTSSTSTRSSASRASSTGSTSTRRYSGRA